MNCTLCGAYMGEIDEAHDEYDLAKAHLPHCDSEIAAKARKAIEEEK